MATTRRLAAILAADVAGYSRLMAVDEEGTHERLRAHFAELFRPKITEHRGRVFKDTGDGFLAEFASVVDAVRSAVEMQRGMAERNAGIAAAERIELRIGINLGDVIAEDHDIFGDGVNVAARLEALAEPGGICVSRVVRDQVRDRLPYPFEDKGEQQVKNIARPIRAYRVGDLGAAAKRPADPALPLADKPSIAVLPFQNMSGDPEQGYFADGMVEEIITALSRIRWLGVIARGASFGYKEWAADARRVGWELGVRYILDGSVRHSGNRVRMAVQLVDAETAAHLWADRFDGTLGDAIELQEKIAISIVGLVEPLVEALELHRSAGRAIDDLTAHDCYLHALPGCYSCNRQRLLQALQLLDHAIERDPGFGPALAVAAGCRQFLGVAGWADDPAENRRQAIELARRALQADSHDPVVLTEAARVLGYFTDEVNSAIALIERALAFNPSYARAWYWNGWIRLFAGQPEPALEHFQTALRLNPRHRPYMTGLGAAHFFSRRYQEAAEALIASLDELPGWPTTYRFLAASYAYLGKPDKAREAIDRLQAITPAALPLAECSGNSPFRDPEQAALYAEGLRAAALGGWTPPK